MKINYYKGRPRIVVSWIDGQWPEEVKTILDTPEKPAHFFMHLVKESKQIAVERAQVRRMYKLLVDNNQMIAKILEQVKNGVLTVEKAEEQVETISTESRKLLSAVPFLEG